MEKEKELCMTPVDLAAGGEELQLLKALVPYLALGLQKPFVLLIKCMEIRNSSADPRNSRLRMPGRIPAFLRFFRRSRPISPVSRGNSFPRSCLSWR